MAHQGPQQKATERDGFWIRQLPDGLKGPVRRSPWWARLVVGCLVLFFLVNQGAELVKNTAQGQKFIVQLLADPVSTVSKLLEEPEAPATARQLSEMAARQARIEAKLDALARGRSPSAEQKERRSDAVRDLVADPDPEARAAVDELASEGGDVEKAVARLEGEARNATAEGAAKWRRIGDLVAGFDTTRALHAYEEAYRLQPDDFRTVVLLARQRRIAGDLAGALDAWEAAKQVAEDDRERMIAFGEASTSLLEAGWLENAAKAMQQAVVASERLAASNKVSPQAQRDLSVSLERLGDVEVWVGDQSAARSAFERSLEVMERLAASNPGSAGVQRDLSVSLIKLADVEVQAGDLSAAREAYERSLEVLERLAASNPGSAEAQRDLSVGLERLGDLEERSGDIVRAVALYERSLPIAENLARSNPSHPGLQRDLEITELRLAVLRAKLE